MGFSSIYTLFFLDIRNIYHHSKTAQLRGLVICGIGWSGRGVTQVIVFQPPCAGVSTFSGRGLFLL